jgi:hypothetical protein
MKELDFSYVVTYQVFALWREEPDFEYGGNFIADVWATNPFCPEDHPGKHVCWNYDTSSDPYELTEGNRAQIELAIGRVDRPIEGLGQEMQILFPVRFPSEKFVGLNESETIEKVKLLCEDIEIRDPGFSCEGFELVASDISGVEVFAE